MARLLLPGAGGSGVALAERLRRERPAPPVIFSSGYLDDVAAAVGLPGPLPRFLPKPFASEELAQAIRRALSS